MDEGQAPRRFTTALISSFAAAAVLLALLGIYGIIAYSTAQRTQGNGDPPGARLAAFQRDAAHPDLKRPELGAELEQWRREEPRCSPYFSLAAVCSGSTEPESSLCWPGFRFVSSCS